MIFNSLAFLCLLGVTLFIYYSPICRKFQVQILIISSLIFYAWHYWELTFLLIVSVLTNAYIAKMLLQTNDSKRVWAYVGVAFNLFVLALFKYSGLLLSTFSSNRELIDWVVMLPLPIGISFYTFQGISMVVDVFRGNQSVLDNIKNHSTQHIFFYIAFFPQLIAGPIVKAHDFLPQIGIKRLADIDYMRALHFLIVGYFLKMVIADNLKDYTFWMEYPYFENRSTFTLMSFLLAYSAQIFADFEGYSMIANGVATLFGYKLHLNFNFPYIASSFSDFWRRWHISLSSFLKEYLYIPLGGNRKGNFRTYFNLLLTMLLGGLWHGAAWSYVVWGGVHGIALAIERIVMDIFGAKKGTFLRIIIHWFIVQIVVIFAWLTFQLNNFQHVLVYLKSMFINYRLHDNYKMIGLISVYVLPVVLYHVLALLKERYQYRLSINSKIALYVIMIYLIMMNSGSSNAFIYFQF
jgi:alginate O-acetyltransferase complex protein AlgI